MLKAGWKQTLEKKLGNISLFVTVGEECFAISQRAVTKVDNLTSSQEETNTRIALHASHLSKTFPNVIVISEDIDVFEILLSLHTQIEGIILLIRGKKNNIRLIDIALYHQQQLHKVFVLHF